MKKGLVVLMVIGLAFCFVGNATATVITLNDVTKFNTYGTTPSGDLDGYGWGAVNKLSFPYWSLSSWSWQYDYVAWTHNFTFIPEAASIKSAILKLFLADDDDCWGWKEYGFLKAEDGTWAKGEVDTGKYKFDVDVASVADGAFSVKLYSTFGDFFINKSKLTIKYHPVPEPGTFLLLGAGVAGLAIYRRRKA